MSLENISILISLIIIIIAIIFSYFRSTKYNKELDEKVVSIILSDLSDKLENKIFENLDLNRIKSIMEDHSVEDFLDVDSINYIMNIIINDLYDVLYSFILEELGTLKEKDLISNGVYKIVKNNKNIADTITYNAIYKIIDSEPVQKEIESLAKEYWNSYEEELIDLEESNVPDSDGFIEDIEKEGFEYESPENEEEINEELNPQTDDEIDFDSSIDEVVNEDEEEITYFFDSKGRKRDKKTGRYTK